MQQVAVMGDRIGVEDFDALVGPHLEGAYRVALAMLQNPDEANDAVQESALKAWSHMNQLRSAASAKAWFFGIVANQCRTVRRGRWWSVLRVPRIDRPQPDIQTERVDLKRALEKLPIDDRLALFLHFYLDLPLDEVGAVFGVSAAGAKTRIYRAAKKLRPELEIT